MVLYESAPFRSSAILYEGTCSRHQRMPGLLLQVDLLPRRNFSFEARHSPVFCAKDSISSGLADIVRASYLHTTRQIDRGQHENRILARIRIDFPPLRLDLLSKSALYLRQTVKTHLRDPSHNQITHLRIIPSKKLAPILLTHRTKAHLVRTALTVTSLFTLSMVPATDATTFSSSTYVPCPLPAFSVSLPRLPNAHAPHKVLRRRQDLPWTCHFALWWSPVDLHRILFVRVVVDWLFWPHRK